MAILQVEYLEDLAPARLQHLLDRSKEDINQVLSDVRQILADLRRDGDAENLRWHRQYKKDLTVPELEVSLTEIEAAYRVVDPLVLEALKIAAANLEVFHRAQREREMWAVEVRPGILAGRLVRPIPRVGCYIPGGLASYPSSALMNLGAATNNMTRAWRMMTMSRGTPVALVMTLPPLRSAPKRIAAKKLPTGLRPPTSATAKPSQP